VGSTSEWGQSGGYNGEDFDGKRVRDGEYFEPFFATPGLEAGFFSLELDQQAVKLTTRELVSSRRHPTSLNFLPRQRPAYLPQQPQRRRRRTLKILLHVTSLNPGSQPKRRTALPPTNRQPGTRRLPGRKIGQRGSASCRNGEMI
jgi:hypothetical protein